MTEVLELQVFEKQVVTTPEPGPGALILPGIAFLLVTWGLRPHKGGCGGFRFKSTNGYASNLDAGRPRCPCGDLLR